MRVAEKLNEMYPTGLILGQSCAIVGDMGLIINWANSDGTIGEKRYEPNEQISIIEIQGTI